MSDQPMHTIVSSRFGELNYAEDAIIEFPSGLVGFPNARKYILLEHKPPFSWLHSVEDPNLAFVVVDGNEFGENYQIKAPVGDKDIDFQDGDEFGTLVIVTVRSEAALTTANLKAPLCINLRNKKGMQIIMDDPRYSVRYKLWTGKDSKDENKI